MGIAFDMLLHWWAFVATMSASCQHLANLEHLTTAATSVALTNILPIANLAVHRAWSDLTCLLLQQWSITRLPTKLRVGSDSAFSLLPSRTTFISTLTPLLPIIPFAVNWARNHLAWAFLFCWTHTGLATVLGLDLLITLMYLDARVACCRATSPIAPLTKHAVHWTWVCVTLQPIPCFVDSAYRHTEAAL